MANFTNIVPNPLNSNEKLNINYTNREYATSDFSGEETTFNMTEESSANENNAIMKLFKHTENTLYLPGIGELGTCMENISLINDSMLQAVSEFTQQHSDDRYKPMLYNKDGEIDGKIETDKKYASSTLRTEVSVSNDDYVIGQATDYWYYDTTYAEISYIALDQATNVLGFYKYMKEIDDNYVEPDDFPDDFRDSIIDTTKIDSQLKFKNSEVEVHIYVNYSSIIFQEYDSYGYYHDYAVDPKTNNGKSYKIFPGNEIIVQDPLGLLTGNDYPRPNMKWTTSDPKVCSFKNSNNQVIASAMTSGQEVPIYAPYSPMGDEMEDFNGAYTREWLTDKSGIYSKRKCTISCVYPGNIKYGKKTIKFDMVVVTHIIDDRLTLLCDLDDPNIDSATIIVYRNANEDEGDNVEYNPEASEYIWNKERDKRLTFFALYVNTDVNSIDSNNNFVSKKLGNFYQDNRTLSAVKRFLPAITTYVDDDDLLLISKGYDEYDNYYIHVKTYHGQTGTTYVHLGIDESVIREIMKDNPREAKLIKVDPKQENQKIQYTVRLKDDIESVDLSANPDPYRVYGKIEWESETAGMKQIVLEQDGFKLYNNGRIFNEEIDYVVFNEDNEESSFFSVHDRNITVSGGYIYRSQGEEEYDRIKNGKVYEYTVEGNFKGNTRYDKGTFNFDLILDFTNPSRINLIVEDIEIEKDLASQSGDAPKISGSISGDNLDSSTTFDSLVENIEFNITPLSNPSNAMISINNSGEIDLQDLDKIGTYTFVVNGTYSGQDENITLSMNEFTITVNVINSNANAKFTKNELVFISYRENNEHKYFKDKNGNKIANYTSMPLPIEKSGDVDITLTVSQPEQLISLDSTHNTISLTTTAMTVSGNRQININMSVSGNDCGTLVISLRVENQSQADYTNIGSISINSLDINSHLFIYDGDNDSDQYCSRIYDDFINALPLTGNDFCGTAISYDTIDSINGAYRFTKIPTYKNHNYKDSICLYYNSSTKTTSICVILDKYISGSFDNFNDMISNLVVDIEIGSVKGTCKYKDSSTPYKGNNYAIWPVKINKELQPNSTYDVTIRLSKKDNTTIKEYEFIGYVYSMSTNGTIQSIKQRTYASSSPSTTTSLPFSNSGKNRVLNAIVKSTIDVNNTVKMGNVRATFSTVGASFTDFLFIRNISIKVYCLDDNSGINSSNVENEIGTGSSYILTWECGEISRNDIARNNFVSGMMFNDREGDINVDSIGSGKRIWVEMRFEVWIDNLSTHYTYKKFEDINYTFGDADDFFNKVSSIGIAFDSRFTFGAAVNPDDGFHLSINYGQPFQLVEPKWMPTITEIDDVANIWQIEDFQRPHNTVNLKSETSVGNNTIFLRTALERDEFGIISDCVINEYDGGTIEIPFGGIKQELYCVSGDYSRPIDTYLFEGSSSSQYSTAQSYRFANYIFILNTQDSDVNIRISDESGFLCGSEEITATIGAGKIRLYFGQNADKSKSINIKSDRMMDLYDIDDVPSGLSGKMHTKIKYIAALNSCYESALNKNFGSAKDYVKAILGINVNDDQIKSWVSRYDIGISENESVATSATSKTLRIAPHGIESDISGYVVVI